MSLVKRTYVDGETVITAENLNDIQDAIIENEEAIEDQGEAIEGKYTKPSGGIPATDMASGVQTSLGKADTAYQKPSGGIPASDMASGVQTSLGKADTALQSSDIDSTLTVAGKAADAKKTGDEISDVKNTLIHKADVIYDTASGDIASFPDGADGLPVKDLTVGIEPVQDLHGYDNPWPAGGGKNLLQCTSNSSTISGVTFTVNDDGVITVNGTSSAQAIFVVNNFLFENGKTYILSGAPTGSSFSTYFLSGTLGADYGEGVTISGTGRSVSIRIIVQSGITATNSVFKPMIRLASDTDPTFAPYSNICPISGWTGCNISHSGADTSDPTVIPISWATEAGTVYGGTLDVTSGVLTVTDANIASYNGETLPGEWISDRDVYAAGTTPTTGAQVVYKLATPQTYQLTPEEVTTLLGQNNIWEDTGDSTVEYPADTKLYIDKKLAALVAALS